MRSVTEERLKESLIKENPFTKKKGISDQDQHKKGEKNLNDILETK